METMYKYIIKYFIILILGWGDGRGWLAPDSGLGIGHINTEINEPLALNILAGSGSSIIGPG